MTADDRTMLDRVIQMFKDVETKMPSGTEIDLVHKPMYNWNKLVGETFFGNFACAYLFVVHIPQIQEKQKQQSNKTSNSLATYAIRR